MENLIDNFFKGGWKVFEKISLKDRKFNTHLYKKTFIGK